MACLGLLDDAAPLFRSGTRAPGAGVLLALAAIVGARIYRRDKIKFGRTRDRKGLLACSVLVVFLCSTSCSVPGPPCCDWSEIQVASDKRRVCDVLNPCPFCSKHPLQ